MDHLEALRQWLLTYPGLENSDALSIDFSDGQPGSAGLYPQGLEERSRITDVTGTVILCCRWTFTLYLLGRQEDNERNAHRLMDFQQWVQQQSVLGLAPVFGDDPMQERICAQKGKLQKANAAGTVRYAVEMTVDFTKRC